MKSDKPIRKLLILGCIAGVIIPFLVYCYYFYKINIKHVLLESAGVVAEGIMVLASLCFLAAILSVILSSMIVYRSQKRWNWFKLISLFIGLFVVFWIIFFIFIRLVLI